MKKYKFTIKGHEYEVEIQSIENSTVEMEVNGTHYTVEMHRETPKAKTPTLLRSKVPQPKPEEIAIAKAETNRTPVRTPLPGVILSILVKEGDEIKKGDTLLIMEAMKMENNIFAEKAGKVVSIKVKPGDPVLQNDVLLEVE